MTTTTTQLPLISRVLDAVQARTQPGDYFDTEAISRAVWADRGDCHAALEALETAGVVVMVKRSYGPYPAKWQRLPVPEQEQVTP